MSICQRKTKSGKPGGWLVKYKDAATGQWKQRQFKSKSEAEEFDGQAKQAVEMQQALSLRECVVAYIQDHELSESRINLFLRLVNGHNNKKTGAHFTGPAEHLADRYAETLTRQDLESVRSRLRADGIKITTINLYIGILKTVLSWCASEDLIGENPWQKYKSLRGGRTTPRDGTLEDFKAMYPYLPSWMQWASITALALCLRPGVKELFSLKWDAFDWRNGLRDKLEEAKAPIDDLFADIESREEELAKKRNQMIDDQLEKTKAAYDEQMAIMDARFSTEKKLLEDMYQAGVITAAEYEKGLMDLAKEEAAEKNKAESEYNDKTEELNRLKELSQQVEETAKTVLENTKTAYKDQFKNSYEAGLSVKGSGKVGGLLGSRAEAADRMERQITDLQNYIISLANGEYTEEEMLKKLKEFESNDYILAAANGADFIANKPTLMMVGEAGPEHVKVKPAPFDVPAESGGSAVTYTVVINNPVGIDGLTQQVVAAAKKLNNRGIV